MKRGTAKSYRVFVRDWWRRAERGEAGSVINGEPNLVPFPGAPKHTLARHMTEEEAREMCQEYASNHDPGPMSRKAEYEEE